MQAEAMTMMVATAVLSINTLVLVLSEFTYAVDAEVVHNFLIIFGLSYLTLRPVIVAKNGSRVGGSAAEAVKIGLVHTPLDHVTCRDISLNLPLTHRKGSLSEICSTILCAEPVARCLCNFL